MLVSTMASSFSSSSNPNAPLVTRYSQYAPFHRHRRRVSVVHLCTAASDDPVPPSRNVLRNVAISSVLLLGLGLSFRHYPASAAANLHTHAPFCGCIWH